MARLTPCAHFGERALVDAALILSVDEALQIIGAGHLPDDDARRAVTGSGAKPEAQRRWVDPAPPANIRIGPDAPVRWTIPAGDAVNVHAPPGSRRDGRFQAGRPTRRCEAGAAPSVSGHRRRRQLRTWRLAQRACGPRSHGLQQNLRGDTSRRDLPPQDRERVNFALPDLWIISSASAFAAIMAMAPTGRLADIVTRRLQLGR